MGKFLSVTQFVYQNDPRSLKRQENITWKVSIFLEKIVENIPSPKNL